MNPWCPFATIDRMSSAGSYLTGNWKIVLHTTEGPSYAAARSAYVAHNSQPHFTVSFERSTFDVWQHIPIDEAARGLVHDAGTVETNRARAVQIEIVGVASNIQNLPPAYLDGIGRLIQWIAGETGVRYHSPTFLPYPTSYGRNGVRFSDPDWVAFDGICGHQHVPGNDHGDPGALNTARFFPAGSAPVVVDLEGDDEVMQRVQVPLPGGKLDGQGNAWVDTGIAWAKFRNAFFNGAYPPVDGYWPVPRWAVQERDGRALLEVFGGQPNQPVPFVWVDHT